MPNWVIIILTAAALATAALAGIAGFPAISWGCYGAACLMGAILAHDFLKDGRGKFTVPLILLLAGVASFSLAVLALLSP